VVEGGPTNGLHSLHTVKMLDRFADCSAPVNLYQLAQPTDADSLNWARQRSTRCSAVCPAHVAEPGGSESSFASRRRSLRLRAIYAGGPQKDLAAVNRWVALSRSIHPYGNLAGRIVPLIRIRPAVHLTAPWLHGYGKGTLLTEASKEAHVPA
jgi:hypothetical protein